MDNIQTDDVVMSDEDLLASIEAEKEVKEDTPKESTPEENPLAPEDAEKQADNEDTDEDVQLPVDEQEESKNLKLKPKKKSAQERIDELTAARRAAEREAEELRRQLAAKELPPKVEEPAPATPSAGPTPDDVTEAGEPKYPLGEFDPQFIKDLTRFTFQQEREAAKAEEAAERAKLEADLAFLEMEQSWKEKLSTVEQELPDLQEKGMKLEPLFEALEPDYGQFVAQTIMTLDNGPQVLYYLSDNLEEAATILSGGPLNATLSLGALNAMFKTTPKAPVKVTQAPEPPADRVRGTSGRFETPDDTDDLAAFEKKYYAK